MGFEWYDDPSYSITYIRDKNSIDGSQNFKFTVNSDGTISSDRDPRFVLGTEETQSYIKWVHRSHKYILLFENAQEILGLTETHGKKEQQNKEIVENCLSKPTKGTLTSL